MFHVWHKCIKIGVLLGTIHLLGSASVATAAQRIIFSDPQEAVGPSPTEIEQRIGLLEDKSAKPLSSLRGTAPVGTRLAGTPDILTGKEKKKNWLTGEDATDDDPMKKLLKGNRSTSLEKGWDPDSNPFTSESGRSSYLNGNATEKEKDGIAGTWGRKDYYDRRDRNLSGGTREYSMEQIQKEQTARFEEFKKIYEAPSATAPVSSPYEAANSPLNSPWGQRPPNMPPTSQPYELPRSSSPKTPDTYSQNYSIRGFTDRDGTPFERMTPRETRQSYQSEARSREPAPVTMPKRPGSLFK